MPAVDVARAPSLEVQAEGCGEAGPGDDEDAEEDAHFREGGGHGEEACAEDCLSSIPHICFLVVVRDVLVLARLMTLEIHDAWPWCPTSFLPRPRLLSLLSAWCRSLEVLKPTVCRAAGSRCSWTCLARRWGWPSSWPFSQCSGRYCTIIRPAAGRPRSQVDGVSICRGLWASATDVDKGARSDVGVPAPLLLPSAKWTLTISRAINMDMCLRVDLLHQDNK
jgi:hypothetical protein